MITSRVTSEGEITIPLEIGEASTLRVGDEIRHDMQGDKSVPTKAMRVSEPFAVFEEWQSEADHIAYVEL
ncbi:MAG: transcriptional regulator [Candidatus Brevundimonas colombiensis]|uniref:Transcriptional regulator n=1 Tax=Candidatus Brevundimonas colombiensis TaxID=3121376 RepID=A0AAJ6BM60_9CAUL|nr:transcriptional regulator [Brevundimonas sp.]WEK40371.1 MAG: transcriptional regulator [Brevundimonas sp.]